MASLSQPPQHVGAMLMHKPSTQRARPQTPAPAIPLKNPRRASMSALNATRTNSISSSSIRPSSIKSSSKDSSILSRSRPKHRNKLQKRRRGTSYCSDYDPEERPHLGFLVRPETTAPNPPQTHMRGTPGGFWSLDEADNVKKERRTSSWMWHEPNSLQADQNEIRETTLTYDHPAPPSRSSSENSAPWAQTDASTPTSASEHDLGQDTDDSSVYSDPGTEKPDERNFAPDVDIEEILLSAEVLADQYRSLLRSRASMRTPIPPAPSPPPVQASTITSRRAPTNVNLQKPHPPLPLQSSTIPKAATWSTPLPTHTKPKTIRRMASSHSLRKQIIYEENESWDFACDADHKHTKAHSYDHDKDEQEQHSFSDAETAVEVDFSPFSSPKLPYRPLHHEESIRAPTPRPKSHLRPRPQPESRPLSTLSRTTSASRLSACVDLLTSELSAALHVQHPAENKARKSELQIRLLIEAYEGLQEELNKSLGNVGEDGMGPEVSDEIVKEVDAMNEVVEVWLEALRGVENEGVKV